MGYTSARSGFRRDPCSSKGNEMPWLVKAVAGLVVGVLLGLGVVTLEGLCGVSADRPPVAPLLDVKPSAL